MLVLLGAYLATRRVVQRALEPVAEMAHQAAQWSAHDVGQRFGEAPRPGELRDLAASLDSLLDRIGAVLRHEQQLAGELSHELRTPLAVVAAENELLRDGRGSAEERARAHEVIATTTDRMAELLDTLLAQAAQDVSDARAGARSRPSCEPLSPARQPVTSTSTVSAEPRARGRGQRRGARADPGSGARQRGALCGSADHG